MANTLAPKLSPLPSGWWLSGGSESDYESGLDQAEAHSGLQCASLLNAVDRPDPAGFGTIMQIVSAAKFAGKRIQMSAWLKTREVQSHAALWFSVYGTEGRLNVSFDNMCERGISGTSDWQKYDIVLDIPADGTKIGFGVILSGIGQLWVDDFKFQEVGADVEVTDCPCSERRKAQADNIWPSEPVNLSFEVS